MISGEINTCLIGLEQKYKSLTATPNNLKSKLVITNPNVIPVMTTHKKNFEKVCDRSEEDYPRKSFTFVGANVSSPTGRGSGWITSYCFKERRV